MRPGASYSTAGLSSKHRLRRKCLATHGGGVALDRTRTRPRRPNVECGEGCARIVICGSHIAHEGEVAGAKSQTNQDLLIRAQESIRPRDEGIVRNSATRTLPCCCASAMTSP